MPKFLLRRLLSLVLVTIHFVAVPCAMALSAAGDAAPCEHCDVGLEQAPCSVATVEPASDDGGPASARGREPTRPDVVLVRLPSVVATADGLQRVLQLAGPARGIGLRTGRHAGDPPLRLVFGTLLN